jgi:hypothetical protein
MKATLTNNQKEELGGKQEEKRQKFKNNGII